MRRTLLGLCMMVALAQPAASAQAEEDSPPNLVCVASSLRIDPPAGVIEVGHLNFSPTLQRTAAATEAMYLMMRRAFDELGYRRYEWKCDSLNARSRRAAERLGFSYEGLFRQAIIYKNRSRDTAWYSIVDAPPYGSPPTRLMFIASRSTGE